MRLFAISTALLLPALSQASSINWGSEFNSVNVQSDGVSRVDASFTVQLGKFSSGFQPDGANVELWAANWLAFDELLPGEHNDTFGYFTSEKELLSNAVFAPGDQAYVWMYNSQTAVPGSEWLLYTNDLTDGVSQDDWLFPTVPGSQQTMPLSWRVSNATRVLFGGLDPDRTGGTTPKWGDGHGTPPPAPFNLQTHTFVPEPGSAMLGLLSVLALLRRRRVLLPALAAAAALPAAAQVVPTRFAYCVADSGDTLVRMNRFDGTEFSVIGDLGTSAVEAMTWNLRGTTLYAADAGQFGTVNYNTGAFTAIGSGVGTGNGSLGAIDFDDVDGLAADPTNGIIYGSVRREDSGTDLDVLIQINPVTGSFTPNAFGPGVDYVPIATNTIATTPVLYDVDDLGIDPVTGQMFGVVNNSGGNDHLIRIDKTTGAVTLIGQLRLADNTPITDMEGYSYYNDGTFYGTTGNNSVASAHRNRLWVIDKSTGICTLIGQFGSGNDYEGVGALHAGYNTVTGTVFADRNRDAVFNSGDGTQAGVTVRFYRDLNTDGQLDGGDILFNTAVTDGSGFYSFETASTGSFLTVVDTTTLPAGVHLTTVDTQTAVFTNWGNVDPNNDFGFTGDAALGDYVWQDLNGDGVQDPGEPAIAGVRVYLDQDNDAVWDATEPSDTTDAAGAWRIEELLAGTWRVRVDASTLPSGVAQTGDPDSTLDNQHVATLTMAQELLTVDFGYRSTARIFGRVYYDVNGDGDQDSGEPGLQNITVTVRDLNDVLQTITTNSLGDWSAYVMPGTATADVDENDPDLAAQVPAGWSQTEGDDPSTASAVANASISAGNDGYFTPGSLSGTVWSDDDNNNSGDIGLENITLTLLDGSGEPVDADPDSSGIQEMTAVTDANGAYSFTGLAPGNYGVAQTHPVNYLSVSDRDGGDPDEILPVAVTAGTNNAGNDFIEELPVAIGSYIFADINADGQLDPGDAPAPDVTVLLFFDANSDGDLDDSGEEIPVSSVTSSNGEYSFSGLQPGYYRVLIPFAPAGYALSSPGEAGDDGVDDDDNGTQTGGVGNPTLGPIVHLLAGTEPESPVDGTDNATDSTVDFAFTSPKASNWEAWQNLNPLAEQNRPADNPDGDIYDNLIEFAFCYDPRTGVPRNPAGGRGFCLLQTPSGGFKAEIIRPIGFSGLTYTLQYSATIGYPTPWTDNDDLTGIVPTIVNNGNGFETVTWDGLDTLLPGSSGFVRIKVILDDPEATSYTEVQGWYDHAMASQCETYSNPFLKKDLFSATADETSPQDAVNVTGSMPGVDVAALLNGRPCLFLEVIGGPLEGQRFGINAAASDADTIAIDTASSLNTQSPVPDLSSAVFVVREAWTLGDLFPASVMQSGPDSNTADNLLTFNAASQTWTTYYLANLGGFGTYWVDSADTSFIPVNQNARCVGLAEGLFVHRRGAPLTLPLYGVVRENAFAMPLSLGFNLVGGGYPMDESYASRGMTFDMLFGASAFLGDVDIRKADQTLFWLGDTQPGHVCYTTHYLLDAGAPWQRWVSAEDNFVTSLDYEDVFLATRAAFIRRAAAALPGHVVSPPWTPDDAFFE